MLPLSKSSHCSNTNCDNMLLRDWRLALRSPPTYRIGNRTLRFQVHFIWIITLFGILVFMCFYLKIPSKSSQFIYNSSDNLIYPAPTFSSSIFSSNYNNVYPLTQPIIVNGITKYRIGIIADLDTNSLSDKTKNTWRSFYKKGYLSYNPSKIDGGISVSWDTKDPVEISSSYSLKGFSTIIIFFY